MGMIYYWMLDAVNSADLTQIKSMSRVELSAEDGVVYIKEDGTVFGYATFEEVRVGDLLESVHVTSMYTTRDGDAEALLQYIREVFETETPSVVISV